MLQYLYKIATSKPEKNSTKRFPTKGKVLNSKKIGNWKTISLAKIDVHSTAAKRIKRNVQNFNTDMASRFCIAKIQRECFMCVQFVVHPLAVEYVQNIWYIMHPSN